MIENDIQKVYFISSTPYKISQKIDFIDIKLLQAPCIPINTTLIKINCWKQTIT